MKSILISLILFASVSSFASIVEGTGIDELVSDQDLKSTSNIKYIGCNELQIKGLENSILALKYNLSTLQDEVRSYKTKNLTVKEKQFVKNVDKKLECIQRKLEKKLSFKCVDPTKCGDMIMYVRNNLLLPRSVQRNQIKSCLNYLYFTENFTAGIILHEVSHLCGTDDHEYLLDQQENNAGPQLTYDFKLIRKESGVEIKKKIFFSQGHLNADSYRYWYILGFCVPGRDCRE